ncbi:MAG: hypothetical protein OXC44_04325 [Proteobacteria bacterium]|nr:hypothetical protein [Pseudomonadota bacterium]
MTDRWQAITCIDDAFTLVDVGLLLTSSDITVVNNTFDEHDQQRLVLHFAERFAERYEDRDAAEILLESCLLWLHYCRTEALVVSFLERIFEHPRREDVILAFTHLCLNMEIIDQHKSEKIIELIVFLMAQMGLQTKILAEKYPEMFTKHKNIISTISSIMMSMSNVNSFRTRICLVNYFILLDVVHKHENNFQKLMDRFGTTMLNQLFGYLFSKKTENYACHYLVENLPYVFLCTITIQNIVQDIFRHNMLKHPVKFSCFLKFFTNNIQKQAGLLGKQKERTIIHTYLMHLAMLLKKISKLDQPKLSKEIYLSLCSFENYDFSKQFLENIISSGDISMFYKKTLKRLIHLRSAKQRRKYLDTMPLLCFSSREKQPNFALKECSIYSQVFNLGAKKIPKPRKPRDNISSSLDLDLDMAS